MFIYHYFTLYLTLTALWARDNINLPGVSLPIDIVDSVLFMSLSHDCLRNHKRVHYSEVPTRTNRWNLLVNGPRPDS